MEYIHAKCGTKVGYDEESDTFSCNQPYCKVTWKRKKGWVGEVNASGSTYVSDTKSEWIIINKLKRLKLKIKSFLRPYITYRRRYHYWINAPVRTTSGKKIRGVVEKVYVKKCMIKVHSTDGIKDYSDVIKIGPGLL